MSSISGWELLALVYNHNLKCLPEMCLDHSRWGGEVFDYLNNYCQLRKRITGSSITTGIVNLLQYDRLLMHFLAISYILGRHAPPHRPINRSLVPSKCS